MTPYSMPGNAPSIAEHKGRMRQPYDFEAYISFLDELLGFFGFDGLHIVFVELIEDIVPSASQSFFSFAAFTKRLLQELSLGFCTGMSYLGSLKVSCATSTT